MEGELHRKLVEEFADIATIINSDGTITYVSPSVTRTLGYEPKELVGEVGYEYQHPDDRDAVADAIESLQTNPDPTQIIETRFRRADGSWCWIEATLQNRFDDPDISGILVNSRDISQRKRQEQQYQALAEEYRTLLETVEDSMFFLTVESADGECVFRFERLNRSYEEQTGITTEEVGGKTPIDVFGEDLGAELQANYLRCVNAQKSISYEEEVPVETDARFWQTVLTPVITNREVTRIIGITRNITEQVERERQIRRQKEQLDEFASVVSHDLRNPLSVAQGRAELLDDDCDSEHLAPIVRSLDRLEEIIADTLTLAREGQVVSDSEPIELVNLVGVCWRNVPTDEATIEIKDDVAITGDRSRLQHVFENLFRNAVEQGGTEVTVRVGQIGDHGIYVEDTGPGIPEEAREVVFDPGHTSATGGTGFGLTIVKRIAEAHGWEVTIAEGSDGGARFEFTGVDVDVDR
ncbi:sensor histidine kinase [Halorubrum lipolyticum]|uniref:histidine kinase n=1 Tax=Halorubrum lipolyticum DSM 21995 TaxID=1227482 RepID=M0NRD9_9EURY|nr:PAS domain-containing sensor histidine kinase [Halorubrum lipolyticum]EMA60336.1 PAS/PAC sensor signal transduction histidine kinase [Halorubrum lipolyticum DSM 21995]